MATFFNKQEPNVTSSSANRGEPKDGEPARLADDGSASSAASGERSGSCLQVVVERQRRAPLTAPTPPAKPCPQCGGAGDAAAVEAPQGELSLDTSFAGCGGAETTRVEVYRFERVGSALALSGGSGGAGGGRVERGAARAAAAARRAAAEAGAALRLAAGAPLQGALLALRCALHVARDAAAGLAHAASDYGLKPALALVFNAGLQPLLVFAGQTLGGARAAAAPLLLTLDDVCRSLARLLAACRPFHAPTQHTGILSN